MIQAEKEEEHDSEPAKKQAKSTFKDVTKKLTSDVRSRTDDDSLSDDLYSGDNNEEKENGLEIGALPPASNLFEMRVKTLPTDGWTDKSDSGEFSTPLLDTNEEVFTKTSLDMEDSTPDESSNDTTSTR